MSGGSAVNAGIDYQQRVASWLLILFYRRVDISEYFLGFGQFVIDSIAFETDQPVDDVALHAADKRQMLFQIKRNISLSELADSEFAKAFRQFVIAHGSNASIKSKDAYVLATSSLSSRSVTTTLRAVLERLRANPGGFEVAKLSDKERDVYNAIRRLVHTLNTEIHQQTGDAILISLLQRVHVTLIDVESGTAGEKAALTLLLASGFASPALVWGQLIAVALNLAKLRASASYDFLENTIGKYKGLDVTALKPEDIEAILAPILIEPENLPAGKDVVICTEIGSEEKQVSIFELLRFEDDGRPTITYRGDRMTLQNGKQFKVIARFASMASAAKFVARNKATFDTKEILVQARPELIANVEEQPAAVSHRKKLLDGLNAHRNLTNCLHCGHYTFNTKSYLVEIDVSEFPSAIGSIHESCRRPTDRILGEPMDERCSSLHPVPGFDYVKWTKLLMRGQAALTELPRLENAGLKPLIVWSEDVRYDSEFRYVIRYETDGGDAVYCYRRGKIERFNKHFAQENLKKFNDSLAIGQTREDPFAVNLDTWMFGPVSKLEKMKRAGEKIEKVKAAYIVEYSEVLGRIYNRFDNYYTPCCLVRDAESELPLIISNALPLISRPLEINSFIENWRENGIEVGSYKLTILENDMIFDQWMRQAIADDLVPVYDPWLNFGEEPGGIRIVAESQLLKEVRTTTSADNHTDNESQS